MPDANLFHFGLMSNAHGLLLKRLVKIKSDFRYSKDNVYNNYPWPENPTEKKKLLKKKHKMF